MSNLSFFWYYTIFFKMNHLKKNTSFFFFRHKTLALSISNSDLHILKLSLDPSVWSDIQTSISAYDPNSSE